MFIGEREGLLKKLQKADQGLMIFDPVSEKETSINEFLKIAGFRSTSVIRQVVEGIK